MRPKRTAQATLRLSDTLKKEYEEMASRDRRTFSQIVELALEIAKPHMRKRIELIELEGLLPAVA